MLTSWFVASAPSDVDLTRVTFRCVRPELCFAGGTDLTLRTLQQRG
jgi:hypothetical protein